MKIASVHYTKSLVLQFAETCTSMRLKSPEDRVLHLPHRMYLACLKGAEPEIENGRYKIVDAWSNVRVGSTDLPNGTKSGDCGCKKKRKAASTKTQPEAEAQQTSSQTESPAPEAAPVEGEGGEL